MILILILAPLTIGARGTCPTCFPWLCHWQED